MTNFLDLCCPSCGDSDRLDVLATVWLRLTDDGTDADASHDGDHDYTPESPVTCHACGYAGRMAELAETETA